MSPVYDHRRVTATGLLLRNVLNYHNKKSLTGLNPQPLLPLKATQASHACIIPPPRPSMGVSVMGNVALSTGSSSTGASCLITILRPLNVSYGLNSLKGVLSGLVYGSTAGDQGGYDYGSYGDVQNLHASKELLRSPLKS